MTDTTIVTANPAVGQPQVFKRLTVDSYFTPIVSRRILVEWALDRAFVAPGPFVFTLYRGLAVNGEFQAVSETTDQPWLYDNDPRLIDQYYRVTLTDGNGRVYVSQAVQVLTSWNRYDWTLAREIIRKETMLQRKRAGTQGWLLKQRVWGDPCSCADPVTRQVTDPNCGICFGTGIAGGYYPAYEYWTIMSAGQRIKKLDAEQGLMTASLETVRGLAYPSPSPGDVWVQAGVGRRFRVLSEIAVIARHRGVPLILDLRLEDVPTSDPVYNIPVTCE